MGYPSGRVTIFGFPSGRVVAKMVSMTVEVQPTSVISEKRVSSGRPQRSRRSQATLGWVISAAAHLLAVALFIIVSSGAGSPPSAPRAIPRSTFEPQAEPLNPEPVIDNLQVQTLNPVEPLSEMTELPPAPELPIAARAGAIAADTATASSYVVAANPAPATTAGARFCGVATYGDRICYVIDCSGSMVMAFDYVRGEVQQAVAALNPSQYFHVIFFAGGDPVQPMPPALRRASLHERKAAIDFVDNIQLADVSTSAAAWQAVVKALEVAFTVRSGGDLPPQTIYFFTDGEFDHGRVGLFVAQIQQRLASPVNVNVIACGSRDNEPFLQRLAANHQGRYIFLSDEQLAAAKPRISQATSSVTIQQ